jgi:gamma-glutamyltranspeptidase / glutathione hydrolase
LTEDDLKAADNGFELLKQDPSTPDGFRAPREGEIFKCPTLASTLRKLASHGKAGFYEGSIAEAIVHATQQKGGFLTLEDLKHHSQVGSEIGEAMPLKLGDMRGATKTDMCSINGLTLWEHPPNGQGIVALICLGIIQHLERAGTIPKLDQLGHNTAKYALSRVLIRINLAR